MKKASNDEAVLFLYVIFLRDADSSLKREDFFSFLDNWSMILVE